MRLLLAIIFLAIVILLCWRAFAKISLRSSLKTSFIATIASVIAIVFIIIMAVIYMVDSYKGTTTKQGVLIIQEVGLEKINKEAKHIFDNIGTNNSKDYMAPNPLETKSAPIICDLHVKLGRYIGVFIETEPEYSQFPLIVVPFGSHFYPNWLYIGDPRNFLNPPALQNQKKLCTVITSNMFVVSENRR